MAASHRSSLPPVAASSILTPLPLKMRLISPLSSRPLPLPLPHSAYTASAHVAVEAPRGLLRFVSTLAKIPHTPTCAAPLLRSSPQPAKEEDTNRGLDTGRVHRMSSPRLLVLSFPPSAHITAPVAMSPPLLLFAGTAPPPGNIMTADSFPLCSTIGRPCLLVHGRSRK